MRAADLIGPSGAGGECMHNAVGEGGVYVCYVRSFELICETFPYIQALPILFLFALTEMAEHTFMHFPAPVVDLCSAC